MWLIKLQSSHHRRSERDDLLPSFDSGEASAGQRSDDQILDLAVERISSVRFVRRDEALAAMLPHDCNVILNVLIRSLVG
jgi:hypothetical protein